MHWKLVLIAQLLVLGLSQICADDSKEPKTEPPETTTPKELLPEAKATALPENGLQQLDEGKATSLPETTISAATTAIETATTEAEKKPDVPLPPQYPLPYPQPHPYGYGLVNPYLYPNFRKEILDKTPSPGVSTNVASNNPALPAYPGYPLPNYPVLRPPFSPYGSPIYPRFGSGPPVAAFPPVDSAEAAKSEVAASQDVDKTAGDALANPSTPSPVLGYPPIYGIQRRPLLLLPGYPYARPLARGYGTPYGYGR